MMGWVHINPELREAFHRNGLRSAADFLSLAGLILSGHPNRHVMRIELSFLHGAGAFLKKEHRVPWRDRLANACAGFGFVSKSSREAKTLQGLAQAGVPCPDVLAVGEHAGKAFLLLRENSGAVELRHYLQQHPDERLSIAHELGQSLAQLHARGFWHGDLYAKHVLVGEGRRIALLDWQRAGRRREVSWAWRRRDLATLDGTLPHPLADDALRRVFLRSYLKSAQGGDLLRFARDVRRLSLRLQFKPRIRALRQLPLPPMSQNLVWLDGEALCVTGAYYKELDGKAPHWLRFRDLPPNAVDRQAVSLSHGRAATLVRRSFRGLRGWPHFWRRNEQAPEVRQAALLYRLERHSILCPKLLAFGARRGHWSRQSFLLSEPVPGLSGLSRALESALSVKKRADLLRQAGMLLRQIHEAGYILGRKAADFGLVCGVTHEAPACLALSCVDELERKNQLSFDLALADLPNLGTACGLRAPEALRFFLSYMGTPRLTAAGRALARKIRLLREVAR